MSPRHRTRRSSLVAATVVLVASASLLGASRPASAVASSTTRLKVLPAKQTDGNAVTLQATVASMLVPTGAVEFFEGASSLGTAPVTNRVASLPHTFGLGSHSVTARYAGDIHLAASTSGAAAVFVGTPSNTKIVLQLHSIPASPVSTWMATTPIRLVANVGISAGFVNYGARTGTVTIRIDGTPYVVTVERNRVVLDIPGGIGSGAHTAVATYHGDLHYNVNTSTARHVTIH